MSENPMHKAAISINLKLTDFAFAIDADRWPRAGLTMFLFGGTGTQPGAGAKMPLPWIG